MSEYADSPRHATSTRSAELSTPQLVALLLSSHPPVTLLLVVVPTAFGISRVGATPLVFGFAGLILIGLVVGYSGLGRRIRHGGGLYAQVTAGLGRSVGLGAGALLFVSYIGLVSSSYWLATMELKSALGTSFGVDLPLVGLLIATVVLIQGLSLVPIRILATGLIVVIGLQLLLFAWMAWAASAALHSPADGSVSTTALDPGGLLSGSFVIALILALTGFVGSEGATAYSGDLADPYRSIPRATFVSYGVTTVVLVLGAWAISGIVGPDVVSTATGKYDPLAIIGGLVGRSASVGVINLLGFVAYLCIVITGVTLNNYAARQLAGMAGEGALPRILVARGASTGRPSTVAFLVQPVLAGLIALVAQYASVNALPLWVSIGSGLGVLAVLALASASAAVWFLVGDAEESGFMGWEGQVVAGLFAAVLISIVFVYGVTHVEQVAPGSPPVASWLVGGIIVGVFGAGVLRAQYLRVQRPAVYAGMGEAKVEDDRLSPMLVSSGLR